MIRLDGAGLACGVFEYLLSLGEEAPKVIAATHFHGRTTADEQSDLADRDRNI